MTLLLALLLPIACHSTHEAPPTLAELGALDEEAAGERLMESPMGLSRLDAPAEPEGTAIIAVHGFKSEGSEWVEPLRTMAAWGTELYFYRWSWMQCPVSASAELDRALDALVAAEPSLRELIVLGHSYGGLMSAVTGQTQQSGLPTRLHLIAAPLAGVDLLAERCPGEGLSATPAQPGVTWRQWRTVHEADGAFRDMPVDPQVKELPALEITQLPAEWEGGRLGHNRSIQYVVHTLEPTRGR